VSRERATALLANYFYFQDVTIDDIYQMRIALEPELAASLAGQLHEAQLTELEIIMRDYAEPATDAEEERRQHVASLRFHARLSDFGGNAPLGFMIGFLAQILTDLTVYKRLYATPNHDLWNRGRQHQTDLIAALRQGDAPRAREVMRSHMEMARDLMEIQEAQVMKRFIAE
jgi:DNA-binding GntR family transcriptional regulator